MESQILSSIMNKRQQRLKQAQDSCSLDQLMQQLKSIPSIPQRVWPLSTDNFDVIAEVKRASPSLGPIPWKLSFPT